MHFRTTVLKSPLRAALFAPVSGSRGFGNREGVRPAMDLPARWA
jgi:hypothetical protein